MNKGYVFIHWCPGVCVRCRGVRCGAGIQGLQKMFRTQVFRAYRKCSKQVFRAYRKCSERWIYSVYTIYVGSFCWQVFSNHIDELWHGTGASGHWRIWCVCLDHHIHLVRMSMWCVQQFNNRVRSCTTNRPCTTNMPPNLVWSFCIPDFFPFLS